MQNEDNSNVIQLDAYRPHISGCAVCAQCKHKWVAVVPVGVPWLECPRCTTFKGAIVYPAISGNYVFECACGSHIFTIYPGYYICAVCGATEHPT